MQDELISRQAALDVIDNWEASHSWNSWCYEHKDKANEYNISAPSAEIEKLPSVTPQPKTGHWIFQKIKYGEHLAPLRMWCSNCNSAFDLCCNQIKRYNEATRDFDIWIYCPWCGAKMIEPQERSEE